MAKRILVLQNCREIVSVEMMDIDRYGRTIEMLTIDSINVNEALLQNGLAWHYKLYDKNPAWTKLEDEARKKAGYMEINYKSQTGVFNSRLILILQAWRLDSVNPTELSLLPTLFKIHRFSIRACSTPVRNRKVAPCVGHGISARFW